MRRLLYILLLAMCGLPLQAQTHLRIHHQGGGHSDVPLQQIDSITFVSSGDEQTATAQLTGSWLWGDAAAGYYELIAFNADKTYTGYDNYFDYGFDTTTYGWYMLNGALLTLQSNGYGYTRRYNWFVTALTTSDLEVMTKMGHFTYHRLQPDVIVLSVGGPPVTCSDGDAFVFADGVVARITDGSLFGVVRGTTYVQKFIARSNTIVSYKVIVE